jgi:His-Xaa-Ser system protein HxsD
MATPQIETLDAATSTVTLSLEAGLYPIDVLYGAAYVFIDRAYVLLDRVMDEKDGKTARYIVHIRGKGKLGADQLQALSGELANELLSQALRRKVVKANQKLIEDITTQAISGAAGGTLPADFLAAGDDDNLDFLEDPLGIAMPWEEKFSKKKKDGEAAT